MWRVILVGSGKIYHGGSDGCCVSERGEPFKIIQRVVHRRGDRPPTKM